MKILVLLAVLIVSILALVVLLQTIGVSGEFGAAYQVLPGGVAQRAYGGGAWCFKTYQQTGYRQTESQYCATTEEAILKRRESLEKRGISVGPIYKREGNI